MEDMKINFSLEKKEMTAQEFIGFCKKLILDLKSFDNIFSNINVINIENKSDCFFNDDLSNFNFENLYQILNDKDIAYKNANPNDINLNANSKSWAGFSITLFAGVQRGIQNTPDVSLSISQGSYEENGTATLGIKYSKNNQNKLNKEYAVRLIELVTKNFNVSFANVITNNFFLKVRQRGKKSIGWINYYNNENLIELLEKKEVVKVLKSGIIFSLSDTPPFNNPHNLIERSKEIANFLK